MNDSAIGIAILDRSKPGREYLYLVARSDAHRYLEVQHIPVCEIGKNHQHAPPSCLWGYRIQGDKLAVNPSLRIFGPGLNLEEVFHNTYAWEIPFKVDTGEMWAGRECEELNHALLEEVRALWSK